MSNIICKAEAKISHLQWNHGLHESAVYPPLHFIRRERVQGLKGGAWSEIVKSSHFGGTRLIRLELFEGVSEGWIEFLAMVACAVLKKTAPLAEVIYRRSRARQ